jgi:hypothetical protein
VVTDVGWSEYKRINEYYTLTTWRATQQSIWKFAATILTNENKYLRELGSTSLVNWKVRLEVLTVVNKKMPVLCVVAPCRPVWIYIVSEVRTASIIRAMSDPRIDAARTFKNFANLYRSTRRYNPEDSHLRLVIDSFTLDTVPAAEVTEVWENGGGMWWQTTICLSGGTEWLAIGIEIEYEDDCVLQYCAVQSGRKWSTFQRCLLPPSWRLSSMIALMTEAVSTSETSITLYQNTGRKIPEENRLQSLRHENMKSHQNWQRRTVTAQRVHWATAFDRGTATFIRLSWMVVDVW